MNTEKPKVKKRYGLGAVLGVAIIVAIAAYALGLKTPDIIAYVSEVGQNKTLPDRLDFSSLQDAYDALRQKYDDKLSASALLAGAEHGLVSAAGDPYTVYFTKSEAQQFNNDLEGNFSGIGAVLDKVDNQLEVSSTLDSSPARNAGLLPNDKIIKVNDQDTTNWSIDQAVAAIRGEAGTTVKLAILRGQDLKDFSIVRANITAPSVTWNETPDNLGYMRISQFSDNTADLATKAAQEFKDKNVKGVILDLRGDGGGLLSAAQSVASLWLNNKVIVQEKRDSQVVDTLMSGQTPILGGVPTMVLVDGGSASASEIVAGALHDNNAAKLVGVQTFGKGSVQQFVTLPNGDSLKVTVAKWYTPGGKNINKQGLAPDYKVSISDSDIAAGRDPQKDKATQLLLGQ